MNSSADLRRHQIWTGFLRSSVAILLAIGLFADVARSAEPRSFAAAMELVAPGSKDQDDMCLWVHPTQPDQSLIISSDKSSHHVYVYDLGGQIRQSISVTKPGNIDLRRDVSIDGKRIDLVVVNQRQDGFRLVVFRVNPEERTLQRIDNECPTGPNYGGCLYHSTKTGKAYFICTSETGNVEQHELRGDGQGRVNSSKVRTLSIGKCEGAVADDETATLFISEEKKGVWKFGADPDNGTTGELIIPLGDHGLRGDVEGLAIGRGKQGEGYLLLSDQGANRFLAYSLEAPHRFVNQFSIEGAAETDGIEAVSTNLGPQFPSGIFACHTGRGPRGVLITSWDQIAQFLATPPTKD